jgi:hypothetical protein
MCRANKGFKADTQEYCYQIIEEYSEGDLEGNLTRKQWGRARKMKHSRMRV